MFVRSQSACQTRQHRCIHAWLTQRELQINVNKTQAMFISCQESRPFALRRHHVTAHQNILSDHSWIKLYGNIRFRWIGREGR